MLTDGERKKLMFLKRLVEQGKSISDDETRWLIRNLEKMLSRPDEFAFPEYAALYDPKKEEAFALQRVERPNWQRETSVAEDGLKAGVEVFSSVTECDSYSAFLVVRPWIRIHPEASEPSTEVLRKCTLSMSCDVTPLIQEGPIEDYLILKDGGGVRWWMEYLRPKAILMYSAFAMIEGKREADPTRPLGVFMARDTQVSLRIRAPRGVKNEPLKVLAGLTAMLYTTKAPGGGAELSMPRELKGIGL